MIDTTAQTIAQGGGTFKGSYYSATGDPSNPSSGSNTPQPSPVGSVMSGISAVTPPSQQPIQNAPTPTQQVAPATNPLPNPGTALPAPTVPYDQASQNLTNGGLQGPALASAQDNLKRVYGGFVASKSGSAVPATGGDARAAIANYTASIPPPISDPVTKAVDDSTTKLLTDINDRNNTETTAETVQQYTNDQSQSLGIPAMKTELMNIQNLMNGTEDDVRQEIQASGGFATESQIEGLTAARNKTLLKQASNIQNSLSSAQDSLTTMVSGYSADRSNAINALNDRVSGDQTALQLFQNIQTQANGNYDKLVSNIGYTGLAQTLTEQDPTGASANAAEKYLGLPTGTLSNPKALQNLETYRQQSMAMSQQRLNITIANNGTASGSVDDLASAVLNGQLAPSQLPGYGKNSLRSQVESAVLAQNSDFNFENADSSFNFQKNVGTQTTVASLNYTKDTLNQLSTLSSKLDRGNITFLNKAGQYFSYNGSDPNTVAFITKANGAIDDVSAALGGGVSTDMKTKIAQAILDPSLSDQAFKTQINTDLGTIQSRLNSYQTQAGLPNSSPGGVNIGGTLYSAGQTFSVQDDSGKTLTMTAQEDGTIKGSDGKTYDTSGNEIK